MICTFRFNLIDFICPSLWLFNTQQHKYMLELIKILNSSTIKFNIEINTLKFSEYYKHLCNPYRSKIYEYKWHHERKTFIDILRWYLLINFISLLISLVFTNRNSLSVNTKKITVEIIFFKKNQKVRWYVFLYGCFYWWNYSWIETEKAIQWCVTSIDRIADELTDINILLVNPSIIVNIWTGYRFPLPYFSFTFAIKQNCPPPTSHPHPFLTFLVTLTIFFCGFSILSKSIIF